MNDKELLEKSIAIEKEFDKLIELGADKTTHTRRNGYLQAKAKWREITDLAVKRHQERWIEKRSKMEARNEKWL